MAYDDGKAQLCAAREPGGLQAVNQRVHHETHLPAADEQPIPELGSHRESQSLARRWFLMGSDSAWMGFEESLNCCPQDLLHCWPQRRATIMVLAAGRLLLVCAALVAASKDEVAGSILTRQASLLKGNREELDE